MGPGASMVSLQTLAKSIVRESLRPKADEVVLISTYPHTIELAEQAAIECQKAGADPAIWLDTDAVFYGQFKNYSDESLRRVSGHCLGLLDYVNSYIWLFGPRNPGPMATVPREKFAAYFEGRRRTPTKGSSRCRRASPSPSVRSRGSGRRPTASITRSGRRWSRRRRSRTANESNRSST